MLLLVLLFDLVPLTKEGFKSSIKGNQRRDTQYAPFVLLVYLRAKRCKDFSRKMACKGHQKEFFFKSIGNHAKILKAYCFLVYVVKPQAYEGSFYGFL